MKAIVFHQHGGVEVLEYGEIPTPEPGPGEVLVRLHAAGLNRLDLWVLEGWPGIKISYPHIPGADGAGVVAALGPGVAGCSVGDRVVIDANIGCGRCAYCLGGYDNRCQDWQLLGETRPGTFAEYLAVPARQLYPLPEGFDMHVAAGAALVYHTAWHSLIERGRLRPGESVLVVGASGGVNTACIDIARFAGATVYVVGSSRKKLALAEQLGADHLIDRSEEPDWSKRVYALTNRRGVDVVVDNVGTTYYQSFRSARKGGRILTVGNTGGPKFEFDNRYMFAKHLSLIGSTMGTLNDFAAVMDLITAGKLHPALDRTYSLAEARQAYQRMDHGDQMGKITLEIGE